MNSCSLSYVDKQINYKMNRRPQRPVGKLDTDEQAHNVVTEGALSGEGVPLHTHWGRGAKCDMSGASLDREHRTCQCFQPDLGPGERTQHA